MPYKDKDAVAAARLPARCCILFQFRIKWKCTQRTSAVMITRLGSLRRIFHYLLVLWEMCFVLLYGERGDAAMTRRHLHSFFSAVPLAWIMRIRMFAHGISAEIKYAHIRVKHFFSRFHWRMRCNRKISNVGWGVRGTWAKNFNRISWARIVDVRILPCRSIPTNRPIRFEVEINAQFDVNREVTKLCATNCWKIVQLMQNRRDYKTKATTPQYT